MTTFNNSIYSGFGAQAVNLSGNPGNVERRVVSFQDATYIAQIADGSERNGLLENLSRTTNLSEINDSIVTLSGFSTSAAVAVLNLHFNPSINDAEGCLVLAACNLPDQAAAVNVFTSQIAIGDDTAVGDGTTTARVGNTDIKYDILSPSMPQVVFDARNSGGSAINRIHLLAIDSFTSGTAEETDLIVTARVW